MTVAMQLLMYAKSIKEVTLRDLYAKLRQLIHTRELDNYKPDEITHIANYFLYVASLSGVNSYTEMIGASLYTQLTAPVRYAISAMYEKLFGARDFAKLMDALEWKTFTYSIETVEYKATSRLFRQSNYSTWPQDERDSTDESVSDAHPPSTSRPPQAPVADGDQDHQPSTSAMASHSTIHADLPWSDWLDILALQNFKGTEKQYDPIGNLIYPIKDVRHLPIHEVEYLSNLNIPLNRLARKPTLCTLSQDRAHAYGSDIKNSRIGCLLPKQPHDWKAAFAGKCDTAEVTLPITVIHGAGGSGKSRAIQQWLNSQGVGYSDAVIICPTTELRADWESKVPRCPRQIFKTFEKALVQASAPIVIMDDYTKLPAGYIEAYCAYFTNIELLILTGDPMQSSYHEENFQAATAQLPPAAEIFTPYCRYYLNATHRNVKTLANALGVYSEVDKPLQVTCTSSFQEGWPVLAPSMIKKAALADLGRKAHTYAGCQGLTTSKVQILLDTNTPLCSNQVMYTALSRAVDTIHFINTGPTSDDFWSKLNCTPYLKTFLDTTRRQSVKEDLDVDLFPEEVPAPTTHFPVENNVCHLEDFIEALPEKYARELFSNNSGHSNTIQTEDAVVQLFQHQQAKDETLLWATIEQRLAISTVEDNLKEMLLKKDIGDILFLNYCKAMCLPTSPIPFEPQLWESSRCEVERTYLSKPTAALINGMPRQSPDFDVNAISLFLKSQWVKKVEKLGAIKVKPGQTIASFMQETVMTFGTMARYMRRIRQCYQPRRIYINCETDPDHFHTWVMENWDFRGEAHSNDFTAFDQSQDGAMLQFEILKAKHHNIPQEIIDAYIMIKTHAKIFLGTLAIMRLSGEGPTFDANTECSIAYHYTRFHISPNTALVFAGDDMAQDTLPVEKPSFALIQDKLKLVSKTVRHKQKPGDFATFCGWCITPIGPIKDPLKLYSSLQLAKRIGKEKEVAESYAIDASYAYRKGDGLHNVLTEQQGRWHSSLIRELHHMGGWDIPRLLSSN
uniref:RNA-directed RNA polymerase n=1 Tax=Hubei alphaflexi-like virus TaxID=1922834 RepID=A0A1L3KK23_9VIRU|nr:hypothetical protein [Hubei alphaflexi-like virus]